MRFVFRHPVVTVVFLSILGTALGFVGGIAWCLHDYPDSPQAPLFGIFVTGPAGFVLGVGASVVLLIVAGRVRKHDESSTV